MALPFASPEMCWDSVDCIERDSDDNKDGTDHKIDPKDTIIVSMSSPTFLGRLHL